MDKKLRPLMLALRFHETYERLAPSFGYETRTETRCFDDTTPNGRLMVAVCGELLAHLDSRQGSAEAMRDACIKEAQRFYDNCYAGNERGDGARTAIFRLINSLHTITPHQEESR